MRICRSCGGRYEPIGADGARYFHACPLRRRVKVRRGAAELLVDLDQVLDTDVRLAELDVERPNRRNENVRRDPDGVVKPIAEGDGTTDEAA